MNIPNVGFNHDKSNNTELEIIELSSLYERTSLSHDPEAPHRVSFLGLLQKIQFNVKIPQSFILFRSQ